MRMLMLMMFFTACATVPVEPPQAHWQEMDSCPLSMDDAQFMSGVVRCRAQCSSYGRDFERYQPNDCRCVCKPEQGTRTPSTQM